MDETIKTSGYRVSPAEVEEIAFETGLVAEVAALGIAHRKLGHAIVLVARAKEPDEASSESLLNAIRPIAPNYMVPAKIIWRDELPRNSNGKLDRHALATEFADLFQSETS